ncbi:hypothetical protein ACLFLN_05655 [Acinetobacter pittii]
MYTIRVFLHWDKIYDIALNNEGNFIILELLDSEFRMGHQISFDGEKVFNLTLNDDTDAVIKLESN